MKKQKHRRLTWCRPRYAGTASARVIGIGLAILLLAYLLTSMSGVMWP